MSQHEIFHPTDDGLPEVLRELIFHIGHDAAMKLVRFFGGTSLYIPSDQTRATDDLREAIGLEAVEKLCLGFGGSDLYIPRCLKGLLLSRNIAVCLGFEELITSMGSDAATNVLARRYTLSNRYIYMILKGTDPKAVTAERNRRRVVGRGERQESASGSVPSKTMKEKQMKHSTTPLRASLSIQLPADAKDLPTGFNIQLFPEGQFAATDGRPGNIQGCAAQTWTMDATIAPDIISDVDAREVRPMVDYEHQSIRTRENGQPAPAAGWIQALAYFPGRGMFAKVEWTERARQLIKAGEYRYISPLFEFDNTSGAVLRFINAALTNTPALDGLMAVAASSSHANTGMAALTDSEREAARLLGRTESEFLEDKRLVACMDNPGQAAALTASEKEAARLLGMTEAEFLAGKEII